MRRFPFVPAAVAPMAGAAVLLAGCGVYFVGDSGENGTGSEEDPIPVIVNPPTYDPNAVLLTVDIGTQFTGEQVDLRIDGVRVYRKNVTTAPGAALTERVRLAILPGPHTVYARIGTATFNVNTSKPVDVTTQRCLGISFAYNAANPQASRVAIDTPLPATCPR